MNTDNRIELLRWYDARRRELPWRRTREPYRIWVSEVMLQQTRAETVIPYYKHFLQRFPTIAALAAAETEEVLSLWSGLGYYRRARQLHRAARMLVEEGGEIPRSVDALRRLPGVGPYTAAAVASIAFGVAVPALDGNVVRVLARRQAMAGNPRSAEVRRQLESAAARLLAPQRPGDSNQALMDLGATVCRPHNPDCPRCPLRQDCRAAQEGAPMRYPSPRVRRALVRQRRWVAVVRDGSRILLFRRPEGAQLLAGIWELPWAGRGGHVSFEDALASRYGGSWRVGPPAGRVHHRITYRVFEIEVRQGWLEPGELVAEGPEAGWFGPRDLDRLPLSSLVRKVLCALAGDGGDRGELGG